MNRLALLFVCVLLIPRLVNGQPQLSTNSCPQNIGFELGNFTNWECSVGKINIDGSISVSPTSATGERHTIYKNAPPFIKDAYGDFSVKIFLSTVRMEADIQ
jgi:hypothetical protein